MVLLDVVPPPLPLPPGGVTWRRGDVCDAEAVAAACEGVDCVFHVASWGMSERAQLETQRIEEINVGGTTNVVQACVEAGVAALVLTYTYNVVFGGQEVCDGDESMPPWPPSRHVDAYSRTKTLAEAVVLAADRTPLPGRPGRVLRTCAIRPAAIWGPGEQRHLPRVVRRARGGGGGSWRCMRRPRRWGTLTCRRTLLRRYVERGLLVFVFGRKDALQDFVHVENLVQAHVCAARACLEDAAEGDTAAADARAGGQAFFVHDDEPGVTSAVNTMQFFRPVVEGLGYRMPTLRLPIWVVYPLAWCLEWLQLVLAPLVDLSSLFLLTRAEVQTCPPAHAGGTTPPNAPPPERLRHRFSKLECSTRFRAPRRSASWATAQRGTQLTRWWRTFGRAATGARA